MLTDTALKWLERYCISKETAEHFNLTVEDHHFPELECDRKAIRIPYVVNGTVVGSRWVDHKENWTSDLQAPHLWNTDARKPPTLYVCDNELAVMALHGAGVLAICPSDYRKPDSFAEVKYLHDVTSGFTEACLLFSKTPESLPWERSLSHVFASIKATTTRFHEGCQTVFQVLKTNGRDGVKAVIESRTNLPPHGIKSFADYSQDIYEYYHGKKIRLFSTGIPKVDSLFKIKKGSLHIVTGCPGSGKGELIDQVVINTIKNYEWFHLMYSPENMPPEFHFQKLAEKWCAQSFFGRNRMTEQDMIKALAVISKHVKFIPPEEGALTIDELLDLARLAVSKWGISTFFIDPYNEVEHNIRDKESETSYISAFLSKMRNFGRLNDVATFVVAHPVKLKRNEVSGEYPPPSMYDISGSAHWRNKADVGITVWRSFQTKTNEVTVATAKIRDKNVGVVGDVKLYWDFKTGILREDDYPYVDGQPSIPD